MEKNTILIVDDSDINRYVIESMLTDYETLTASCEEEVYPVLENNAIDLILLDVVMPGKNGHEIAIDLQQMPEYADIPIIFVSAKDSGVDILEGFNSGGFDYITKPVDENVLRARLTSVLKHSGKEISLKKQATTDPLTGLYNRRFFFDRAEQEWDLVKRQDRSIAIAMMDIDHFKKINDQYGHDVGDFILTEVSKILTNTLRLSDILARYGGEEFIIMFTGYTKEEAFLACMRIRTEINKHVFKINNLELRITMTYGVSDLADISGTLDTHTLNDIVKVADDRLYYGKESGRNMVSMES